MTRRARAKIPPVQCTLESKQNASFQAEIFTEQRCRIRIVDGTERRNLSAVLPLVVLDTNGQFGVFMAGPVRIMPPTQNITAAARLMPNGNGPAHQTC